MTVILAIHAHPDDIETLGAGTLALLAAKGHTVKIVTVTAGDCGSAEMDLATTAQVRRGEAAAAATLIGADYRCADIPDLSVFNDDPCRRRVTEMVRWAAPDIVITASPADYHPDHEAVSVLVRDACFAASVPNYKTGEAKVLAGIPHLYFMDPIGGRDREGARVAPDFGAEVGDHFAAKQAMLAAHRSQDSWVSQQHDISDHQASMEAWTRRRGRDFGVPLAEGFRQYRHHPYPRTPLLQELLGEALVTPAN
ncbi:PIG-L deacetylase family protein [Phenylobacterium sp.]|uniref:PIG-L deacetylase family protein n=1 Tax=Phenylobacterium sp. TaxID=1871053 RepID=UPI00271E3859|nr:PIG-L family deacetylase [Phenylobacterium sp.]MDO8378736.1 PIG-L family deacetylase [Phenylobacterium sp.]